MICILLVDSRYITWWYINKFLHLPVSKKLDELSNKTTELSAELEEEKVRADTLLYQMLPQKIANRLKESRNTQSGIYSILYSFSFNTGYLFHLTMCESIRSPDLYGNLINWSMSYDIIIIYNCCYFHCRTVRERDDLLQWYRFIYCNIFWSPSCCYRSDAQRVILKVWWTNKPMGRLQGMES